MKLLSCNCDWMKTAAWSAGILGTFLIVAVLVGLMLKLTAPPAVTEDRNQVRRGFLAEIKAAEAEFLKAGYVWEDKAKGFVRIPVDRAVGLVVKEWENPAAARAAMLQKVEKALVKPPEPKSEFE